MKINGYGIYDPLNNVNSTETAYKTPAADVTKADKVIISDEDITEQETVQAVDKPDSTGRPSGDVNEIAFRLRTYDGFNTVDRLGEIKSLEISKAVSEMKTDESLEQYQYFVGDVSVINDDDDGVVIQKSGFDVY